MNVMRWTESYEMGGEKKTTKIFIEREKMIGNVNIRKTGLWAGEQLSPHQLNSHRAQIISLISFNTKLFFFLHKRAFYVREKEKKQIGCDASRRKKHAAINQNEEAATQKKKINFTLF